VAGRPILARDLVAPSGEAMPVTDVLPLLVERAIRRALILEEARARGIELPPTAHAEIEVARREMAAPGLTSILGRSPAEVDAELQDAAAMMLEAALLASLGHTPDVTAEDVARHRAAHPEDAVRPDAAIRSRLAQGKQAGYDDAASALVARLRALAGVEVHEVVVAVGTGDHN